MDGTVDGVIAGTAGYMSPEQARGKTVDKRTDIWAFGCVVYEILTARSAFRGETVSDTIGAVLEREPNWSVLPAQTPVKFDDCCNAVSRKIRSAVCATSATRGSKSRKRLLPLLPARHRIPAVGGLIARSRVPGRPDSPGGPRPVRACWRSEPRLRGS